MIRKELIDYVEREILPRYAAFDGAHNIDHAETVIAESAALAAHYAQLDAEMVYVIAAFHDTGLCKGRELHHIVSGEILRADAVIGSMFTPEQVATMSDAIEDHRASAKGDPRTLYGRIVAEADRIISPEITLRRTVQFGLDKNPQATQEEHFARFNDHLQEKYAKGGYLKLYIPYSGNAARLEELQTIVENPIELRHRFDKLFADLTK